MTGMTGVVKSWNGLKGFGFIEGNNIQTDVLFSKRELPEDFREVQGKFLTGSALDAELRGGLERRVGNLPICLLVAPRGDRPFGLQKLRPCHPASEGGKCCDPKLSCFFSQWGLVKRRGKSY
ncbi:unnamed protein product [Effrenium voratum]|uniref:CSD domain-containing protein n=1 Tax=Effrenium voratum TaxID=2562239 RepID=A0AA36N6B3_9DINO|nr:unnamed protein product [Effrenium voratum]